MQSESSHEGTGIVLCQLLFNHSYRNASGDTDYPAILAFPVHGQNRFVDKRELKGNSCKYWQLDIRLVCQPILNSKEIWLVVKLTKETSKQCRGRDSIYTDSHINTHSINTYREPMHTLHYAIRQHAVLIHMEISF